MKKLFAVLMMLTLVLSMAAAPAFADEPETGSITINGVSSENIYSIYKILDLESYSTADGAYSYVKNTKWADFFDTAEAKKYISFETKETPGYASWIAGDDAEATAKFAKLALAYAEANNIAPEKSSANTGEFVITDTTGVFSNLEMGYYLVDSTMGALCGLTTTNPDASINAKNGIPILTKHVREDSTGQFDSKNNADIGQDVEYRVTINVHAGAQNYILHDKMDAGITYQNGIEITHNDTLLDASKYTVVTDGITDGCTFHIVFDEDFCEEDLELNDKLIVTYMGMLNRNAVIAGAGNENAAWLSFGDTNKNHKTAESIVTTYTYGIDIIKTDGQNTLIDGAKFKIYDAAEGGNEVAVVLMDDGVTYRRARADETGVEIEVENGKVRVVGFDNGIYYLEETEAPDGYNKLSARQRFIITDGNLDATFNGTVYSSGSGVHVVNKTGSMLPETGGFGTTMFILIGGLAVLAAGVLLFVNKRMSQIAE